VPPTWPPAPGEQRTMMHLDIQVDDLDAATAGAVALGARVAEFQPQANVRVLLVDGVLRWLDDGRALVLVHHRPVEQPGVEGGQRPWVRRLDGGAPPHSLRPATHEPMLADVLRSVHGRDLAVEPRTSRHVASLPSSRLELGLTSERPVASAPGSTAWASSTIRSGRPGTPGQRSPTPWPRSERSAEVSRTRPSNSPGTSSSACRHLRPALSPEVHTSS